MKLIKFLRSRGKYSLGILSLLCVVVLWVGASFLMGEIFLDYNKPFLTTYLNTSTFILHLLILFIKERLTKNEDSVVTDSSLSNYETATIALQFCVVWFLGNYFVNMSLSLTNVASSTIISSTSSFWTLLISVVMKVDKVSTLRIASIIICISGVVLVALFSPTSPDSNDGHENWKGDLFSLAGAIIYGFYISFLKFKIKDESRVNLSKFFGFLGLANTLVLWPLFFIFDALKIETFELPSHNILNMLLINAFLGTFLSEYLWLLSMVSFSL
jgi:solute carrier family 35 protein F5